VRKYIPDQRTRQAHLYFHTHFQQAYSPVLHYTVHPCNPQRHILERVVSILHSSGGICVYPTDTVYGMGACAANPRALDRIGRILQKDKKRLFSFICHDFSQISTYARISNADFKLMKRYLPGPFTFILPATNYVPKKVCPKRKTVGIRMPACRVLLDLVRLLGEPLANTSIDLPAGMRGDPGSVKPAVLNDVDVMLDIGILDEPTGSTIVDLTCGEPCVIRSGKGIFES
jgi:tRNA threonylcarbamoyl adenosine modification protein (Sua5/YciO/YrdC/YwlC family)